MNPLVFAVFAWVLALAAALFAGALMTVAGRLADGAAKRRPPRDDAGATRRPRLVHRLRHCRLALR